MPQRPGRFVRPLVRDLLAYTPGEQPKIRGLIKLNTNENPYPPSPRVLRAVRAATDERLRLYPNPRSERLRQKLACLHRCRPEQIIVGNGSDELLALAHLLEPTPSRPHLNWRPCGTPCATPHPTPDPPFRRSRRRSAST